MILIFLHRHDHAAIVGVHAADTAGVHDQASFELCLFHKKLLHGLGAVRSIAVGDHQETFLRIPCLFQNDLRHSSECFLHADALASLHDTALVSGHDRLDVQRGCHQCFHTGQSAVLAQRLQIIQYKIGMHIAAELFDLLHDFFEGKALLFQFYQYDEYMSLLFLEYHSYIYV